MNSWVAALDGQNLVSVHFEDVSLRPVRAGFTDLGLCVTSALGKRHETVRARTFGPEGSIEPSHNNIDLPLAGTGECIAFSAQRCPPVHPLPKLLIMPKRLSAVGFERSSLY